MILYLTVLSKLYLLLSKYFFLETSVENIIEKSV